MAACLAAIIASLRARRSSSRRASAFFAASACRSAPSRLSAFFWLAGAAGFSSNRQRHERRHQVRRELGQRRRRLRLEIRFLELRGRGCLFLIDARLGRLFPRRRLEQRVGEERRLRLRLRRRESRRREARLFFSLVRHSRQLLPEGFLISLWRLRGDGRFGRHGGRRGDVRGGPTGHRPRAARRSRRARASSLERCEPDADLPALRVVGPRDDGCEPSPRVDASGAGVFAFAAFAAEASSFPATEAGEIRSISMTSASRPSRRAPSRDTEAGLVFLSLA